MMMIIGLISCPHCSIWYIICWGPIQRAEAELLPRRIQASCFRYLADCVNTLYIMYHKSPSLSSLILIAPRKILLMCVATWSKLYGISHDNDHLHIALNDILFAEAQFKKLGLNCCLGEIKQVGGLFLICCRLCSSSS